MTARYTHDELLALSKDKGPLFDGSARQALVWAAATLDAADLAVRETQAENAALRSALHKLACLGNGDQFGNSIGNDIARAALGK